MNSYNRVILMGRLTRDPNLRFTMKGRSVLDLGMALNSTWKDRDGIVHEKATFLDITFWGQKAEVLSKHMQKGDPLHVEAHLSREYWEDKHGKKQDKLRIVGDSFQFIGTKKDREKRGNSKQRSIPGSR